VTAELQRGEQAEISAYVACFAAKTVSLLLLHQEPRGNIYRAAVGYDQRAHQRSLWAGRYKSPRQPERESVEKGSSSGYKFPLALLVHLAARSEISIPSPPAQPQKIFFPLAKMDFCLVFC
jgi:hypothetical protein